MARALDGLPAVYREVLEPRLREGSRGVEIARQIGRDPAVVRSQIRRGLSLLRGALPRSFLASLAFLLWSRRTLAAVRGEVLRHAATGATGSATVAAAVVGGVIVSKSTVVAAFCFAVVVTGVVYVSWPGGGEPGDSGVSGGPQTPRSAATAAGPAFADVSAPERIQERQAHAAATPADAINEPDYPESYARQLSGVTGRLLEADGEPAANLDISLLEIRPKLLYGQQPNAFSKREVIPRVELSRGKTDDQGWFHLGGAHGRGIHGLGVDLGGPRAALRIVDVALAPGEVTDLGDVYLDPIVALTGRVVDEEGEPIAGARVRAGAFPVPISMLGLQHARSDSLLVKMEEPRLVFDMPAWAARWLDRLPVPTTTSGEDGRFRLAGASQGAVTTIVDHRDYVAAVAGPSPTGSGGACEVGDVVLPRGRTLEVRVLDRAGNLVEQAEVIAGPVAPMGVVACCRRADAAAEAGRFTCGALSEDDELTVAVRATPLEPWLILDPFDADEITVTLPAEGSLTVVLADSHGHPVSKAELRLSPLAPDVVPLATLHAYPTLDARLRPAGGGVYRIGPLTQGAYTLAVRAHGVAPLFSEVVVGEGDTEVPLVLEAGRTLLVRVLEARSGQAIERAEVSIIGSSATETALVEGLSDERGNVELGPVSLTEWERPRLWVEHPGYASAIMSIGPADQELEVRLSAGGSVTGRLTAGGQIPREPYFISMMGSDAEPRPRHRDSVDGGHRRARRLPGEERAAGRLPLPGLPAPALRRSAQGGHGARAGRAAGAGRLPGQGG